MSLRPVLQVHQVNVRLLLHVNPTNLVKSPFNADVPALEWNTHWNLVKTHLFNSLSSRDSIPIIRPHIVEHHIRLYVCWLHEC
jgi:hypothetical protein